MPASPRTESTGEHLLTWRERLWIRVRSSLVGIMAAVSDFGTLAILKFGFGIEDRAANAPSLVPGLVVMFVGNKLFAFDDRSKALVRQSSLFLLVELAAFGLNILVFDLLVVWTGMNAFVARGIGTFAVYQCFSFPLWSWFVFRHGARDEPIVEDDEPDEGAAPQAAET